MQTTKYKLSIMSSIASTRPMIAELAGILGSKLGWYASRKEAEINRTAEILQQEHGVAL